VESGSKSFIQPNQPSSIRTNAVGYLLKEQISPRTFHCVPLVRAHDLFSLSRFTKFFLPPTFFEAGLLGRIN